MILELGEGGCISLRGPYIASDIVPGTGSHISSDMRPGGRISLEIWDRGDPKLWGAHFSTTPVL